MTMNAALVTGASTGLGRELAGLFAADGHDIVLVASPRSSERLQALTDELSERHGVTAHALTADLAEPGAAARLVRAVDDLDVHVDHLVNNAGVGIVGLPVQEYDADEASRMIQLNVGTLTDLTIEHSRRMVAAGRGRILNVSSVAAYVAPHGLEAGYSATKAYVRAFSESVAHDLRGTGVTCTHLAPGPTKTEFFSAAGLGDQSRLDSVFRDAHAVARAGYEAMLAGRTTVMPGVSTKAMRWAATVSPSRRLTGAVSGYFVSRH